MKTEQFDQLKCVCALDAQCASLIHTMEDNDENLPEEIESEAGLLRMAAQTFRDEIWKYMSRNMDTYIDEEENEP